jgi:hypothetical protein
MVHVTLSWRSREDQVEDRRIDTMGCVGPYYQFLQILFIFLSLESESRSKLYFYLNEGGAMTSVICVNFAWITIKKICF